MAQPYGGTDHGLHFPLHKGCEVALACQDGDPDRPVIVGALPNPNHKSVVTNANQTRVNLQTCGDNRIYFEDKPEAQRALLQSTSTQTFMRFGVPNDPFFTPLTDEQKAESGISGIAFKTPYGISFTCGSKMATYAGAYIDTILGSTKLVLGLDSSISIGLVQDIVGYTFKARTSAVRFLTFSEKLEATKQEADINKTELITQLTTARGRITQLSGEVQQLHTTLDTLSGEVSQAAVEVTQLAQETLALNGEVSNLVQQNNKVIGQVTKLNAQVDTMSSSNIEMSAQNTVLSGEVTALENTATQLDTQRTQVLGELSEVAQSVSQFSGVDITV